MISYNHGIFIRKKPIKNINIVLNIGPNLKFIADYIQRGKKAKALKNLNLNS